MIESYRIHFNHLQPLFRRGSSPCATQVAISGRYLFFHITRLRRLRGSTCLCGVKHGLVTSTGRGLSSNGSRWKGDWIAKKWWICASEQKVDGCNGGMKFRRPNDWMTQRKRCCRSVGCRVRDFDLLPNR